MKRGPAGRRGSLLPPLPQGSQASAAAASGLGSLTSLVEPRLSEVLLDCGDVPVGGLRSHGGRREGGDG